MIQPDAVPEPVPGCILLVEDDAMVRFPIAEALRELGIIVVEASTADEAWDHLRIAASSVDLVFTDSNMPGSMTGEELASKPASNIRTSQQSSHQGEVERGILRGFWPSPMTCFGPRALSLNLP